MRFNARRRSRVRRAWRSQEAPMSKPDQPHGSAVEAGLAPGVAADSLTHGAGVAVRAAPPQRGVAETVPIEHETSERIVRTMVVALPAAALGVGGGVAWGGALHWQGL